MKRFVKWTVLIAAACGIAFFIYQKTRPEPVSVSVKPAERGNVAQTVANTRSGTVKACRRARLSPSIGGQIDKLPIREGDTVEAGQLLLEIWNEDLRAQLLLAEGELVSAQAQARAADLTAAVAEREAARLTKLLEQGVGAESQTDRAVSEAKALRADSDAAAAVVKVARARVAVAVANLQRTRLTAPFDGIVAEINGEMKEYVTPSPIGVATLPTLDIIERDCFYVAAPIDEVDAGSIRVGMPATITMDSFRGVEFEGKVRRVSDYVLELEKQARTVEVEVDFENADDAGLLLAGYSADVEIILETRAAVIRVPTEAVLEGARVFVFHPETGLLESRKVDVGISNWMYTEVLSGLKEAEQVVINVERPGIRDGASAIPMEARS
jgi:HlyD family secretion protein